MDLETNITLADVFSNTNLTEILADDDLTSIGRWVKEGFQLDKDSRSEWEDRTEESLKLALQVVEDKNFPWADSSNVKFPLLTIAALQYHARAYPALVSSPKIVKCSIFGETSEEHVERARRIESHMSYQVLEEDACWEDNMDRVLITQPIVGCAFKKTYFDPVKRKNVSENILAKDLVVSYYTKTLDTSPRISECIFLSHNEIRERQLRGTFKDIELTPATNPQQDTLTDARNESQGTSPPIDDKAGLIEFIEQHCFLDLDGDGYQEPYIVTIHKETCTVMKIVPRFFMDSIEFDSDGRTILSITPEHYYTKFPFIPSPDGGFYDLGFGTLLGPLNSSINTLINQLIDSGTMSNTAGGFIARGVKVRGGEYSFSPNEWKPVDSTGDDLRKGIMPLPVREPSNVLFTLLSLLINYGERIGGSVDIMVGENPGQNTPAETSRTMTEQGMKIFSSIFKRTYRSLKTEFRKMYRLNQLYVDSEVVFDGGAVTSEDYLIGEKFISPAADPNMVSDSQRAQQAQLVYQMSLESPDMNSYEVKKRVLEANKILDIESILPDPKGPNAIPQQPHHKVQEAQVKAEAKLKEVEANVQIKVLELQLESELNKAKIQQLQASALESTANAMGESTNQQITMAQTALNAAKLEQEGVMKQLDFALKLKESYQKDSLTLEGNKDATNS